MSGSEITDITVLILRDIRDRLDGTNQRLDTLNGRVDSLSDHVGTLSENVGTLNDRVGTLNDRVGRLSERVDGMAGDIHVMNERFSLVEHAVRVAADQVVTVGRVVKNRHEAAIDDLRERVARLEAKASG